MNCAQYPRWITDEYQSRDNGQWRLWTRHVRSTGYSSSLLAFCYRFQILELRYYCIYPTVLSGRENCVELDELSLKARDQSFSSSLSICEVKVSIFWYLSRISKVELQLLSFLFQKIGGYLLNLAARRMFFNLHISLMTQTSTCSYSLSIDFVSKLNRCLFNPDQLHTSEVHQDSYYIVPNKGTYLA